MKNIQIKKKFNKCFKVEKKVVKRLENLFKSHIFDKILI